MPSNDWMFSGDVSLVYGGIYVRVTPWGYADVVEVTDLDSACGFEGAVLIEKGSANLPSSLKVIRAVMASCGWTQGRRSLPKEARRAMLFECLWRYGHRDVDESEVVQTEEGAPMENREGWKAEKFVAPDDLEGYVASRYLD